MKKLIFLQLIFIASHLSSNAQNFQLGFTGGLTIANYDARSNNIDQSSNPKAGFSIGTMARIPIWKRFYIQPEINWVQKGTKDHQTNSGIEESVFLTTNHIEIPLNFLFVARNGFFAGAGPSFSYAVSGKMKYKINGSTTSERVHFGNSSNDIMKPFDFGMNVLTGYRFKNGLMASANFNYGASNLSNGSGTGSETLNSYYFGIKIGYVLEFKKHSTKK